MKHLHIPLFDAVLCVRSAMKSSEKCSGPVVQDFEAFFFSPFRVVELQDQ